MTTPAYLTTAEVAVQLRRTRHWVAEQCHNGALRAAKLGDEWRLTQAAVDEYMAAAAPTPAVAPETRTSRRTRSNTTPQKAATP